MWLIPPRTSVFHSDRNPRWPLVDHVEFNLDKRWHAHGHGPSNQPTNQKTNWPTNLQTNCQIDRVAPLNPLPTLFGRGIIPEALQLMGRQPVCRTIWYMTFGSTGDGELPKVIWANQKTEYFVVCWLCGHAMIHVSFFPCIYLFIFRSTSLISSVLSIC